MIVIEGRFEVKLISSDALVQYMEHREMSIRKLASKVGCSHSVIGHLHSGHRKTCRPETAKAIEKALGAPRNSLFVPGISTVSREVRSLRKAS